MIVFLRTSHGICFNGLNYYFDMQIEAYILSSVMWCPLWFPHTTMFGASVYLPLFVWGSCLIYVICVRLHIVVSNTYSVVFMFWFSSSCFTVRMLPVSLDCPFLITPSVFSKVYLYKIRVIIKLPNTEQSSKGKGKTH